MKTLIQKDTCTPMFIAALFTIAKTWKQPECPSTEEWIKKMEYYSAIKQNEILPFPTTWMDFKGIMLSEISQTEKDKCCMISFICGIQNIIQQTSEYNRKEADSGLPWWRSG